MVIFSGIVIGLVVPGIEKTPKEWIMLCLALNIFISCFRIAKSDFSAISLHRNFIFYITRFLLLPVILFGITQKWMPAYAVSVLLITLMPTGTAAPAVTILLEGNTGFALSWVVFSSLLVPISVPSMFYLFHRTSVNHGYGALFVSLLLIVIVPVLIHFPFRSRTRFMEWAQHNAKFLSALFVTAIIVIVVGIGRESIFSNPASMFKSLTIVTALYIIYYLFGWIFGFRISRRNKIGFTVVSGVNNNALGTGIALLHFAPQVALFLIISEVPWTLGIAAFGKVLKWSDKRNADRIKMGSH